jgi:hypothetical protein
LLLTVPVAFESGSAGFMKKTLKLRFFLIASALCVAAGLPLRADTIYNNTSNDSGLRFNPAGLQVGDEIVLSGTARYLTNFSFEYWGTNTASPANLTFSGSVQAEVRFYQQNGTAFNGYASPGTLIYDSGLFPIIPTPRSTINFVAGIDFPVGGLLLPVSSNMTWSVQFFGLGVTDSVGLDIYSPATVGGNFADYWQLNGSTWTLLTNSAGPISFGARLQAAVPEPSSLMLGLLSGAGLMLGLRRVRRKL